MFVGEQFDNVPEFRLAKSLLLDLFRGRVVDGINLKVRNSMPAVRRFCRPCRSLSILLCVLCNNSLLPAPAQGLSGVLAGHHQRHICDGPGQSHSAAAVRHLAEEVWHEGAPAARLCT